MFQQDWMSKFLREAADVSGQSPAPETPVVAADVAAPDLSFIPADFHTDGKPDLAKFQAHYTELTTPASPKAPDAYDFKIPDGMKYDGLELPEGFTINLDTENPAMAPLFSELGGFLKEMDAGPEAGQKVMGLLARYEATREAGAAAAAKAEMTKLGATAEARLANLDRALATKLPAEQATALKAFAANAAAVQALETLLSGTSILSPTPRPPAASAVEKDLADYYANPKR